MTTRPTTNLDKLGSGQLEKSGLSLRRARTSHQRLSCPWRSVQKNSLWRLDTDVLKLFLVGHRQDHCFDQLLNLLVQATDIRILLSWPKQKTNT